MEIIDIYNEYGKLSGKTAIRGQEFKEGEYHLVVDVWLKNSAGNFLIQKRAERKRVNPSLWAPTGGAAMQGEDGIKAAIREVKEELGIDINPNELERIVRLKRKEDFLEIWVANSNVLLEDVEILEDEVSDVKYASPEEVNQMLLDGSFCSYVNSYYHLLG